MFFRAELRKILPYRTVWIILLAYAVLLLLFVAAGGSMTVNGQQLGESLYTFPGLWDKLSYVASYFTMLLGILFIILITDEFQFRTFRQQVIDGSSVADLVQSKLAVSGLLAGFAMVVVLGIGTYFGLTRAAGTVAQATAGLPAVLLYGVQVLGVLSLAALVAVLVRRSGAAILLFLLYLWVAEPLLRLSLPDELDRYLPAKIFNSLTPMPGQELLATVTGPSVALLPSQALPLALAYTALFWGLSYLLLHSRDL